MNENKVLLGGLLKEEEVVYFCDGTPQLKFKLAIEASPKPGIPSYGIDCFYALDSSRNWGDLSLGVTMKTYLIVKGKLGKCTFPNESDGMKKDAIIIVESMQIYRDYTDIEKLLNAYPFSLRKLKIPEIPKALQVPESKEDV